MIEKYSFLTDDELKYIFISLGSSIKPTDIVKRSEEDNTLILEFSDEQIPTYGSMSIVFNLEEKHMKELIKKIRKHKLLCLVKK